MTPTAQALLERLRLPNPYDGFQHQEYALDLQGGEEHPLFAKLIAERRPRLIIEVGTWKGASAIRMAKLLQEQQLDAVVVCVDTWLGSLEHLTQAVKGWDIRPSLKHGYPTLFYQFLANVVHSGCQDVIVPIPNASITAARWLVKQGIQADLIYIDGSHEEDDVYQDLVHWWRVLRPGGVMFGDDWHAYWYGVICGVNRFAKEYNRRLQVADTKWLLIKDGPPLGDRR